jgi:hypothetical protein
MNEEGKIIIKKYCIYLKIGKMFADIHRVSVEE